MAKPYPYFVSLDEAREICHNNKISLLTEEVSIDDSLNRIIASNVVAKVNDPPFDNSSPETKSELEEIRRVMDSTDTMNFQFSLETATDGGTGALLLESSIGAINYIINEDFTMSEQQPADQGVAFETEAGTTTSSTADDILDFSERNPFGEVDDY